jgi:hypothetical protein
MYYDMGVVAVAGVGLGVFALSNMLVGGVLLAAAPILAILFREKMRQDTRAKALEIVPDVVARADGVVRAKLVEAIADFRSRLTAFMVSASEETRRGILEVLTQARGERQAASFVQGKAEEELETRRARLTSVGEGLRHLRGELWS